MENAVETTVEVAQTTTTIRPGMALIKQEFLRVITQEVEEEEAESGARRRCPVQEEANGDGQEAGEEGVWPTRGRRSKSKNPRLCPSLLVPDRECRFGAKCNAEHSIEAYLQSKQPDLGEKCVLFEKTGKCP
ncbi:TRNA-dihydrouridine(47) synthase [NAD(P)(+)] [Aphelenchoides fujianensis]|nr:TRNA-dihydrouridine(47) synthase [NAD(P)(+)] [Aphelenchoides fujianensis]